MSEEKKPFGCKRIELATATFGLEIWTPRSNLCIYALDRVTSVSIDASKDIGFYEFTIGDDVLSIMESEMSRANVLALYAEIETNLRDYWRGGTSSGKQLDGALKKRIEELGATA